MRIKRAVFLCFFLSINAFVFSQKDSVEVEFKGIQLSFSKVRDFSKGYSTSLISDSLLVRNIKSLTDILRFNSFIYFKEEGLGMVSSPSFRGTNANQTAVLWNGININSQLLGQVDFNAISSNSYDNIVVRSGGGSVLFGSGAIGGTVHLENKIDFIDASNHSFIGTYGSFDTRHVSYKYKVSSKKYHLNFGLGYNSSENDYEYLRSNLSNENGSFLNYNVDFNLGYQINEKNTIKLLTNTFFGDRNFSRTLNAPSNDSYEDLSFKCLLEWNQLFNKTESLSTKFAFVYDRFKFFDNNQNRDLFSSGSTNRAIAKLDYNKSISRKLQFNGVIEFENINAVGISYQGKRRDIFTIVSALNHQITNKLSYGIQLRKDFLNEYNSPFLYSLGADYQFNKTYTFSFNSSKNFRIPTFNDLYWQPGGNPNLKPENSYQFEIGNSMDLKKSVLQLNLFYLRTSDLIQWTPNEIGVWSPRNVDETENYGLEFSFNHHLNYGLHTIKLNSNYSYTIAKNLSTNRQLFYVPQHRANFLVDYNYKRLTIFYQQLINDEVTFLTDTVPLFTVANLGLEYQIKLGKFLPNIGLRINNLYNTYYQNTLNRPMPGINFNIITNINF